MPDDSPFAVVSRFNAYINSADLDGLTSMMTDDHAFIDSAGSTVAGKTAVAGAWDSFFKAFPDYRNVLVHQKTDGASVAIQGHSLCSYARLEGPALWRANVRAGKVAEWRVYDDTIENRQALGLQALE